MNKPLLALIVILAHSVIATQVSAETRTLVSKPSATQLQTTCDQQGGIYREGDAGGYGCLKPNCDGKGGDCSVVCNTKACYGITPTRTTPTGSKTHRQILDATIMNLNVAARGQAEPPIPDTKFGVTEYLNGTAE